MSMVMLYPYLSAFLSIYQSIGAHISHLQHDTCNMSHLHCSESDAAPYSRVYIYGSLVQNTFKVYPYIYAPEIHWYRSIRSSTLYLPMRPSLHAVHHGIIAIFKSKVMYRVQGSERKIPNSNKPVDSLRFT